MPAASAIAASSHGRNESFLAPSGASPGAGAAGSGAVSAAKEGCGAGAALGCGGMACVCEPAVCTGSGGGVTCAGAGRGAAVRAVSRGASAGGALEGAVAEGCASLRVGDVDAGVWAGWSAGFVVVPGRLKFCSSRGPTASVADVLLAGGGSVAAWANAEAGRSPTPAAANIVVKRKPALIQLPLCA